MSLAISVAGIWHFSAQQHSAAGVLAFAVLAAMFALGLAEGLAARVVLGIDSLEIVSNFRRKRILRAEIVRVVGEKGAPLSLELRSGGWLKLPSLGSLHANTVRAWLKKATN